MSHTIFLSTGSNLGNRIENLQQARQFIESKIGSILKSSSIYVTKAWGLHNQPDFYNQALQVESTLHAEEVLEIIHEIEMKMGRIRTTLWSKRLIDIDILFFEQFVIQTERLTIPHPFLHQRNFVLIPMKEIAPEFFHPVLKKTIQELYENSTDELDVKILNE